MQLWLEQLEVLTAAQLSHLRMGWAMTFSLLPFNKRVARQKNLFNYGIKETLPKERMLLYVEIKIPLGWIQQIFCWQFWLRKREPREPRACSSPRKVPQPWGCPCQCTNIPQELTGNIQPFEMGFTAFKLCQIQGHWCGTAAGMKKWAISSAASCLLPAITANY